MISTTTSNLGCLIKGTVAIVGRPNVGKSTLFNRLTRSVTSIIDDVPGVTRDRIYGQVFYDQFKTEAFSLIDTGGFECKGFSFQPFRENLVWQQSTSAAEEADLILLVFDGKHGLHQHDKDLYQYCKQLGKPIITIANKIDGEEKANLVWEFFSLGLEDCLPVSAAHSKGIRVLLDTIKDRLSTVSSRREKVNLEEATKIAIIGRPNAGKSSIINRLIGQDRNIVSEIAGTTRDSIDTPFTHHSEPYVLIDTAGIRRRPRISENLELQSVSRSLRAIDRADVVIIVIDAIQGVTDQDARLINLATDRYKPLLIAINKWDLVPAKVSNTARDYKANIRNLYLKDHDYVPIHFMSCLHNLKVHDLMGHVTHLLGQAKLKIPTARLNESLQHAVAKHAPQIMRRYAKRVKFYYATQVKVQPPTIVIMCNLSDEILESYKRYLHRRLRNELGLTDIPIRFVYRGKKEANDRRKEKVLEDKSQQMTGHRHMPERRAASASRRS